MLFQKPGGVQWIAVFLGNPGEQYANTRHNAGFMTAAKLEAKLGVRINRVKFRSLTATAEIAGQKVLLMKPQTFMNLSGEAVGEAARFYKIPPERIIVVSDEMALPVGTVRVRPSGSAGGHNGLKNIIEQLGSDGFPRVRLGVGEPPHPDYGTIDWVLGSFSAQDAKDIDLAAELAAEAVASYIEFGAERTMSKYNRKVKG